MWTHVISGILTSRETLKDFKYAELCKYVLDYPLTQVTFLAVMTHDKYNSLLTMSRRPSMTLGNRTR